ncbi:MAG: aminopeptidase P family protein [Firmicutes bacterium]|nr:aminopeptidase P family protein [Bacillota bacterium]
MGIPKEESTARIKRTQTLLAEKGLDAALIYYDELNIANGWYLSGWCPQFESGAILVPAQGDACILGGPESEPFARESSAIKETRNVQVFMVPEEEYPMARVVTFDVVFHEIVGRKVSRLGIVGLNKMPYRVYSHLQADLHGIEFIDITEEFEEFRVIKSEWEIESIKKSFQIADEGFKVILENIAPGVPEYYLAGLAEGKMRTLGANWFGFKTIMGAGERSNGVVPTASDRILEEGDTLLAGVSPRYNGYSSAAGLSLFVGNKASAEQKRYLADAVEAFSLTREQLVPGRSAVEIDAVPRNFLKGRGYAPYMLVPYVHTIGLLEAEAPFFGPNSRDVLQPGMTVCIDVSLFGHPTLYGVRVETGYVITEKGAEPLSPYMEDLIMNAPSRL